MMSRPLVTLVVGATALAPGEGAAVCCGPPLGDPVGVEVGGVVSEAGGGLGDGSTIRKAYVPGSLVTPGPTVGSMIQPMPGVIGTSTVLPEGPVS